MLDAIRKILDLLDSRERRNTVLLFGLMLGMGIMEVLGAISVLPFVAVVANSEVVEKNEYLRGIYEYFAFTNSQSFLVFLGLCTFVLVVGRLGFTALTHWAIARFSNMRGYTLSSRLLRGYMGRPYSFFLNRHSADLAKTVLSEVTQVIRKSLMPALELAAYGLMALLLIGLIVVVDPLVALSAILGLGGAYMLIYFSMRHYITRIGVDRVVSNRARFQMAQEALGGIKDVKILGLEEGYINAFSQPAKRFARVQTRSRIIGELPQFGMRAIVFGGILILVVSLIIVHDGNLGNVLPMITLYAYVGNRLIPALQKVYRASVSLRFGKHALDVLHEDLLKTGQTGVSPTTRMFKSLPEPVRLERDLVLDNVRYTYPGGENAALQDLSLVIKARSTVGIVGGTGAGKTTVVDLILCLLEPQVGKLLVDGQSIKGETTRAWQRNLGYVPQSIFLSDDSVAANIAFGVPKNEIDRQIVEYAARIAELHEFVVNEMPQGYDTLVGERGIRLSGGQRQRIGIARALYHDPGVLVLDEATSALDNVTEKAVMDAVHNLAHRKTIIIIAHRLTTVRECDEIVLLEHGRLLDQGTYNELAARNRRFRAMAGLIGEVVEGG